MSRASLKDFYDKQESRLKAAFPSYAFFRTKKEKQQAKQHKGAVPRIALVWRDDRPISTGAIRNVFGKVARFDLEIVWKSAENDPEDLVRMQEIQEHIDAVEKAYYKHNEDEMLEFVHVTQISLSFSRIDTAEHLHQRLRAEVEISYASAIDNT